MIEIDLKAGSLTATLDRLGDRFDDMTELMQDFGEYLVAATETRFADGAGPDGLPWAPKTPATLAAYARGDDPYSTKPLVKSGGLSRSIFPRHGPRFVEVGSTLIYAAVMQGGAAKGAFGATKGGSPIPWGDIPARPYLGISAEDETELVKIVGEWLGRVTDD
jgi:phage gpG-like protein